MQDIYAFDVGDFGKLGLLRRLTALQLSLGVLWWKTQLGTAGADGKHVSYLRDSRSRVCDAQLWDEMGRRFTSGRRNIAALEPLLPSGTLFHGELVPHGGLRTQWLRNATDRVRSVDVVFCDPDNGIVFDDGCCSSPRHIRVAEVRQLFGAGHSLVIYHHLNRSASHERQIEQGLESLSKNLSGLSASWAARFRRGSSRVFYILAQAQHADRIRGAIDWMRSSPWVLHGHFEMISRNSAEGVGRGSEVLPRLPRRNDLGTTEPGYENRNSQVVVRATGLSGTDHLQKVYVLRCGSCGHEYGANGSDIWQRRCPRCQHGRPGLPL